MSAGPGAGIAVCKTKGRNADAAQTSQTSATPRVWAERGFIRFTRLNCMNALRTPTVLHPSAQGCEGRATLGSAWRMRVNPVGVESVVPLTLADETLSGFVAIFATEPRVARGAQPWADGWNTVGVRPAFVQPDGGDRSSPEARFRGFLPRDAGRAGTSPDHQFATPFQRFGTFASKPGRCRGLVCFGAFGPRRPV